MDQPPPLPSRTRPPRLPVTYSAGHERDANPQIGRLVLVVLAVVCLGLQGAEFLFVPHANLARLLAAAARVTISWACFIAVAAGLGWARWPLAVFHVGLSLWLFVHVLMGTFIAAYPGLPLGATGVPLLLGTFFLAAGAWFGASADLSAYLDRDRAGTTAGSGRLVTAAGLAVALGLPAAAGGLVAAMTLHRVEPRAGRMASGSIPLPPQNDAGALRARPDSAGGAGEGFRRLHRRDVPGDQGADFDEVGPTDVLRPCPARPAARVPVKQRGLQPVLRPAA